MIRNSLLGTIALALGATALLAPRGVQGADSRIEILIDEPIGTISPNLYSHFVEHLAVKLLLLVPLFDVGRDFLLRKLAHGLHQGFVVVG